MSVILIGVGIIGLYFWIKTSQSYKAVGSWEVMKTGAYMWLAVWIGLIIIGIVIG